MTLADRSPRLSSMISLSLAVAICAVPIARFAFSPDSPHAIVALSSLPACSITSFAIWQVGRFASAADVFAPSNVQRLTVAGRAFILACPALTGVQLVVRAAYSDLTQLPPAVGLAGAFLAGIGACSLFLSGVVRKGLSLKTENEGFI